MIKKLSSLLLIALVIWATLDAFILHPDGNYSAISRGKLYGILLVILSVPIVLSIYNFVSVYCKTRSIAKAKSETLSFLKKLLNIFKYRSKKGDK